MRTLLTLITIISMSGAVKAEELINDDFTTVRDTPTCVAPDYPEFVENSSYRLCVCVSVPCPCMGYELVSSYNHDDNDSDIVVAGGCTVSGTVSSGIGGASGSVTVTCTLA